MTGEPLPKAGGGGESIMVDSHSECSNTSQIKKVILIHCERGQSGIGWHGWQGMAWHGVAWPGIGLNYTYKEILNALKTKGRCKDIPLHFFIFFLHFIKDVSIPCN